MSNVYSVHPNNDAAMHTDQLTSEQELAKIMTSPWRAQCLYVAVKLEIADLISSGIGDDASLSAHTGINTEKIRRLMRFLVAFGLFQSDSRNNYSNTSASLKLVKQDGSMRDTVLLYGEEMYRCWANLHAVLSSGNSGFEIEYSQDFYTYLEQHGETARRFQRTLQSRKEIFEPVPNLIDFTEQLVVDVGGGSGELTRIILDATPSAKAIVLDLEPALVEAKTNLADMISTERVELMQADMFSPLPEGADVYLFSRVFGDLKDSDVSRLLDNCQNARNKKSRIVIIEQILPEAGSYELSALWDLHLMVICQGRQRTLQEMECLLQANNIFLDKIIALPLGMHLMLAS